MLPIKTLRIKALKFEKQKRTRTGSEYMKFDEFV